VGEDAMGRKHLFFKWQALFFACLIFQVGSMLAAREQRPAVSEVGDRLLLQVNFKVYSQRQMEIYIGTRELLIDKPHTFNEISASTWEKALTQFRDDMVVAEEASRKQATASSVASQEEIDSAVNLVKEFSDRSLEFRAFSQRLSVSPQENYRVIAEILQIANFRAKTKIDDNALKEANLRNQVRFFAGSRDYQHIFFPPQRKSSHGG
jgi:hypothetical protein